MRYGVPVGFWVLVPGTQADSLEHGHFRPPVPSDCLPITSCQGLAMLQVRHLHRMDSSIVMMKENGRARAPAASSLIHSARSCNRLDLATKGSMAPSRPSANPLSISKALTTNSRSGSCNGRKKCNRKKKMQQEEQHPRAFELGKMLSGHPQKNLTVKQKTSVCNIFHPFGKIIQTPFKSPCGNRRPTVLEKTIHGTCETHKIHAFRPYTLLIFQGWQLDPGGPATMSDFFKPPHPAKAMCFNFRQKQFLAFACHAGQADEQSWFMKEPPPVQLGGWKEMLEGEEVLAGLLTMANCP